MVMRLILTATMVLTLLASVIPTRSQMDEPPSSGVYIKDSTGWKNLEQIRWVSGETSQEGKALLPGLPPQLFVWTFRDAHAPVQVNGGSAQFFIRDASGFNDHDVLVVKLEVKKDHRELQNTGGDFLTFKSGFSKDRAPEFQIHKVSDHTFSITPKEPLVPGEYMITISPGVNGYGVSVRGNQSS